MIRYIKLNKLNKLKKVKQEPEMLKSIYKYYFLIFNVNKL